MNALILACSLFLLAPTSLGWAEDGSLQPRDKNWQEKMIALETTLRDLLLDLTSDARFNDAKNITRIEKNAEKFAKLAHELRPDHSSPDADPSLRLIASQFAQEASLGAAAMKRGQREYARNHLKSMTSYCFACHTRSGATDLAARPGFEVPDSLTPIEKANYLASTRRFDLSLQTYEAIVADAAGRDRKPFEWEAAVRSGLAVAVRVKKDPERALRIVQSVIDLPTAPFYFKEQAAAWKESLLKWKSEVKTRPLTEAGHFAHLTRLIGEAKKAQKYPADRSADMLFLRASSAAHDLLSYAPDGKHAAAALYTAGLSYEVLSSLDLWDIHEFYYLACIVKVPNTPQARECYRHYEQSVYFGYTGSGGTHLPDEVLERLKALDALSRPGSATKKGNKL